MSEQAWACTHTFVLTSGRLNRAAESHLTKKGIRRRIGIDGYIYTGRHQGATLVDALAAARDELDKQLTPYGVGYEVKDSTAQRAQS